MFCNKMDIHLVCDFMNRISYAEWMLKEMSQYFPAGVKLFVMYDIACTLKKYLEVSDNEDNYYNYSKIKPHVILPPRIMEMVI